MTALAVAGAPRAGAARLLRGLRPRRPLTLREHLDAYGPLEPRGRSLVEELEASGLAGCGGAGFPAGAKVRAVAAQRRRPVVVLNGAEGEPASEKDRLLLRRLPHLVLDGAVSLAHAVGAREAVVVHSASALREAAALQAALAERGGRDRVAISVVPAPDGYVTGQETAIIQYLNGGPPRPTTVPPRPFESGVRKRPTLVQNVETAAQAALVDRYGHAWFRRLGTPAEPGSRLFTITGAVAAPGVYEAEIGAPLRDLVAAAGGVTAAPKAFLVGGYAGAWIEAKAAASLTLEEAALHALGGTLGVGAVTVLPESACGICESARVVRYLSGSSAGQCGPCVHGLAAIAGRLEQLGRRRTGADEALLRRWTGDVAGRGACRNPDGAARFVASALGVFARDLARHDPGRCRGAAQRILPIPERP